VGVTAELHENSNILDLMELSNLNFDGGFRSMWGFLRCNFVIPIYYVLHS